MALVNNPLLQLTGPQQHLWNDFERLFPTENELITAAVALGPTRLRRGPSRKPPDTDHAEREAPLRHCAVNVARFNTRWFRSSWRGVLHSAIAGGAARVDGATPGPIVRSMVDWAASQKNPERGPSTPVWVRGAF